MAKNQIPSGPPPIENEEEYIRFFLHNEDLFLIFRKIYGNNLDKVTDMMVKFLLARLNKFPTLEELKSESAKVSEFWINDLSPLLSKAGSITNLSPEMQNYFFQVISQIFFFEKFAADKYNDSFSSKILEMSKEFMD